MSRKIHRICPTCKGMGVLAPQLPLSLLMQRLKRLFEYTVDDWDEDAQCAFNDAMETFDEIKGHA